jgi:hypothetical protein
VLIQQNVLPRRRIVHLEPKLQMTLGKLVWDMGGWGMDKGIKEKK